MKLDPLVCGDCPATVPSVTVARAAGWKRYQWDVLRWFVCPMCAKTFTPAAHTREIQLEAK
jgi:hypothetical protein